MGEGLDEDTKDTRDLSALLSNSVLKEHEQEGIGLSGHIVAD